MDSAFQVLEASGAQTLTDLKADSFKAVRPMVRALKDLDKETRAALLKFMSIQMCIRDRWHPIVFIGLSAAVGVVFRFGGV